MRAVKELGSIAARGNPPVREPKPAQANNRPTTNVCKGMQGRVDRRPAHTVTCARVMQGRVSSRAPRAYSDVCMGNAGTCEQQGAGNGQVPP